jgi:hypothetical protein
MGFPGTKPGIRVNQNIRPYLQTQAPTTTCGLFPRRRMDVHSGAGSVNDPHVWTWSSSYPKPAGCCVHNPNVQGVLHYIEFHDIEAKANTGNE